MKPKHFIITLLALLTSITASAYNTWTDANGTVWNFTTSGSTACIFNGYTTAISGTIPADLTIPTTLYVGETPYTVTSIGKYAFQNCSNLTSVTIPSSMTLIVSDSFNGCSDLTSVTILSDVITIERGAFWGSTSLLSVHLASTTPNVTADWEMYTNIVPNLYVPDASVDAYKAAWPNYAYHVVPESKCEYVYDITVTANESSSAVIEEIGEEDALNVVNLKVRGSFNSYDVMVFRNKMKNLRNLDLSDANVVASSYAYYANYKTKDNIVTSEFVPVTIQSLKLPKDITAIEGYAFSGCVVLNALQLPDGITSIPEYAFQHCEQLNSIIIPESVTGIGVGAFTYCMKLSSILLPINLKTIGREAFASCSFTEIHLPPYLTSIGNDAFRNCSSLKTIYAYMPDIISIGTNTFNDYTHQQLYVPEFLYNNYYYDTNWSQFLNVIPTELKPDDYKSLSIQTTDVGVNEDGTAIPEQSNGDAVDVEVGLQGSFTAGEDLSQTAEDAQYFNYADIVLDGEGHGGSLIGEDDGETEGNLRVNNLRVKINVKAGRWYFFCFPFDVTIANCEYPGQYAWRYYDGAYRASNGSGGWKPVTGETLTALEGYAFQTSHTGNLIISFNHPTFGGNRPKPLNSYTSGNAANASWNLVGNPYSSFYDFLDDTFLSPITVYNSSTGSYHAYRPGDDECHLQPYQAFFVQKPVGVDLINFTPGNRESYNKGQEKKSTRAARRRARGIDPDRCLINLQIMSDEQETDRTRVVLNEQKSRDYELDCDASKFLSADAQAQLYTVENGIQMAINERPLAGDIRLGYTAKKAGTLSISAPRMDLPMMLVDTKLGITFDLSVGTYDFETQAGTFNDRFMLCLSGEATAIKTMKEKTGVLFGTQDGGIAIGGAEGKTVSIYTTGGQMAAQHSGNGFIALKSGVYVVNVDGVTAKVSVK